MKSSNLGFDETTGVAEKKTEDCDSLSRRVLREHGIQGVCKDLFRMRRDFSGIVGPCCCASGANLFIFVTGPVEIQACLTMALCKAAHRSKSR